MNERELLEAAAKACGLDYLVWNPKIKSMARDLEDDEHSKDDGSIWNPLTDDGDALRLAEKLRINILFSVRLYYVENGRFPLDICCSGGISELRRSIVCAAAEIGRNMP